MKKDITRILCGILQTNNDSLEDVKLNLDEPNDRKAVVVKHMANYYCVSISTSCFPYHHRNSNSSC